MNGRVIKEQVWRWLVLGILTVLVAMVMGVSNRNVYTKEAVDTRIEAVREYHNRDKDDQQRQLDRIEQQVDKLVDRLIEG